MDNKIDILDHGYVKLIDHMGDDITVVNTARTSFDKSIDTLGNNDVKLINFLVKNKHDSCLRHCVMTFELRAPLMVCRQFWKHVVGSSHLDDQVGWNENSRRYVTENEEFYLPEHFLGIPESKKQGAAGPVDNDINSKYNSLLKQYQFQGEYLYHAAIDDGIAPEQARLFLPAYGLYVNWRWTGSLNAIMNFLDLRLDSHAQSEIQSYAQAVEQFVKEIYPVTYNAWNEYRC